MLALCYLATACHFWYIETLIETCLRGFNRVY